MSARRAHRICGSYPVGRAGCAIVRDEFVVFEPQANISARITKAIGVSCGVGYRETAGADLLGDRVNGPTENGCSADRARRIRQNAGSEILRLVV